MNLWPVFLLQVSVGSVCMGFSGRAYMYFEKIPSSWHLKGYVGNKIEMILI